MAPVRHRQSASVNAQGSFGSPRDGDGVRIEKPVTVLTSSMYFEPNGSAGAVAVVIYVAG